MHDRPDPVRLEKLQDRIDAGYGERRRIEGGVVWSLEQDVGRRRFKAGGPEPQDGLMAYQAISPGDEHATGVHRRFPEFLDVACHRKTSPPLGDRV